MDILATMENDPLQVVDTLNMICTTEILFVKNMAHHLFGFDLSYIKDWTNVFLIRNTKQLIASFAKVIQYPTLDDIGVQKQYDLYHILDKDDHHPLVIDSGELLKDSRVMLKKFCTALNIPFDPAMLSWPAGARPEDGIWAKYWYGNVHKSTGFAKQKTSDRPLPGYLEPLYAEGKVYYDFLFGRSLRVG